MRIARTVLRRCSFVLHLIGSLIKLDVVFKPQVHVKQYESICHKIAEKNLRGKNTRILRAGRVGITLARLLGWFIGIFCRLLYDVFIMLLAALLALFARSELSVSG